MDLSIIILNYRSRELVRHQLEAFKKWPFANIRAELIVVDNNSGDGIQEMMEQAFSDVTFIQLPKNKGYAAGNNAGLKGSTGAYALIINPDTLIDSDAIRSIETLHGFMESHKEVGIAGPKLFYPDGTLHFSCLRFPNLFLPIFRRTFLSKTATGARWLHSYFMEDWDHQEIRAVDWLFGACLMIRRSALERVGLLDERFFLYLEDTDWCRRFWEQDFQVQYVPQAKFVHLLGRSSEGGIASIVTNKSVRTHIFSFIKYNLKYLGKKNPHLLYSEKHSSIAESS